MPRSAWGGAQARLVWRHEGPRGSFPMVLCLIICGVSPMVCQRPAVTVRWTARGVIRGLRLGVRRRLPPEHEQEGVDRGPIAPGGGPEDLPGAGWPDLAAVSSGAAPAASVPSA